VFRGDDFANGRLYSSREAALEASVQRRPQMLEKGWLDVTDALSDSLRVSR
jgi:hypothetical protein